MSHIEHFKVDASGVRRQHELLVQEVKKPNLPTSQCVLFLSVI